MITNKEALSLLEKPFHDDLGALKGLADNASKSNKESNMNKSITISASDIIRAAEWVYPDDAVKLLRHIEQHKENLILRMLSSNVIDLDVVRGQIENIVERY